MPPPRSRRGWLEAAERVEFHDVAGKLTVDPDGGFVMMLVTLGPKFYVRRVAQRFGAKRGFAVTSIRSGGRLVHPFTGELNRVYAIRLERLQ